MQVYRYLKEHELQNLLSGNKGGIGSTYNQRPIDANNHKYKPDTKYLHFFKDKKSIKYLKKDHAHDQCEHYICTFDIPLTLLVKGMGKGKYEVPGMDYMIISQREYIIPVDDFDCSWLISYEKEEKIKPNQNESSKEL